MAFNLTAQLNVALNTASLKNAANTINSQLKDVGAVSLGIPNRDADNLKYIKVQAAEASTAMEQFGRQSGLAAKRFVAFTVTAGAIITFTSSLKQALTAAVEFDREMIRLTQVSTDSVGQVGAVGEEVSRLSKNYGVSSKELLSTAVTLKQANLSLADTKVALEALAQAALAPSFDNLRDTTEGAIAVMNQFGISAKDLGNALGAINAVAAEFAVEAQDLIEGVRKAGGAFKAAGGDLNEFLALFTSIRQTTRESAESIGTGLRTIFTRVQRNETVEALKDIGVQLRYTAEEARSAGDLGLTNQFVGPYEAVKRLSAALNELRSTDPRFSAIVEELGGYRQISKVIPLIQEFGVAQKALGVAQAGGASLALNAAQAQEAFGVKIQKVKEEFADFVRNLTNTSSFRSLIDLLLGAASAGIKLADSLKGILPVITAIAAVKTVQSITGFTKGFANTAFSPAPANQPSTFSPFLPTGNKKADGGFIKMAKGGFVPGSGRGDKVPTLLEPGEFVVPRKYFEYGGLASSLKSSTIKQLVQYVDVDERKYLGGERINPTDKIIYNIKYQGINDPSSADPKIPYPEQGKIFEQNVARRYNGKLAKGNFAVDMFVGNYPYEIKNTQEFVPEPQLEDKLIRFRIAQGIKQFSNSFYKNDTINLGELGVIYNTAKINDKDKLNDKGVTVLNTNKDIRASVKTDVVSAKSNPSVKPFINKKASGGLVPGVGNTDSVPLDLPVGSYVLRKSSVNSIGVSNLSRLGRAKGGVIPSLVMPGEYIYTPDETKRIGVSNLDYMNQTGRRKFGRGSFVAITPEGNEVRDTVDAASEDEARQKIRQMGYTVISIDFPKKKNKKTKITEDLPKEDPYKELKGKDLKLAQQIEGQLRIPTNEIDQAENERQTIEKVKEIRESEKRAKKLGEQKTTAKGNVERGLKNREILNQKKTDFTEELEQRKKIFEKAKNDDEEARRIQKNHYAAAARTNKEIERLNTLRIGAESSGNFAEADRIEKRITALTAKRERAQQRALDKQATIDATTETRLLAEKNVTQTTKNIEEINGKIERNNKFIEDNKKSQKEYTKQERKEKARFSKDEQGNILERGKVITSTYGDIYKNEVQKELDNYKNLYGQEAVGGSRKAIGQNVAQRIKQGYFNQLKSFSEAQGLEFDENFANKQAKQMAREAVSGRRKFEVSDKGEYYDPTLATGLKAKGYNEVGQKGIFRRVKDFGKSIISRENLQNTAFAVSSGIGILGSAIGPQAEDYKKAVAGGVKDESIAATGAGISGATTGLATGIAIGSFAGPIGMAIGGVIGVFTGLISGIDDARKAISDIKLEEAGNKLKNAFEVAASSFGKIAASNLSEIEGIQKRIDDEIMLKSKASTSWISKFNPFTWQDFSQQEATISYAQTKTQYAGETSGINNLLSKQIQEGLKSSTKQNPFTVESFFSDQSNMNQLVRLSIGLNQPIEKIKLQFEKFAKDVEKTNAVSKNQTNAIEAAQKLNIAFSLISDASTNAANSINNLTPQFQSVTDALSSNFTVSQKNRLSSEIQAPSINPKDFLKVLTEVSGGLGASGETFLESGSIIAEVSSLLPNILANISPTDFSGGKDPQSVLRNVLTQELKDRNFDPTQLQTYINSIVGRMGEDFSKMLSEAGGDYGELSKRLMSNVSDPFLNAFKNITANLEKAGDAYTSGINKLAQATISTVQEYEKLSKIQQQQRNFQKNIAIENEISKQKRANPLGARFGEIKEGQIALSMTNIDEQMLAFEEQQSRLTGLNRGNQLDPAQIQERINQNRIQTQQQEELKNKAKFTAGATGQGDYVAATNELGRLKVEASLLNQAMRNLADSTEEMSIIEQRVGKIKQEIANEEQDNLRRQSETENRGERLLTSSPEQIQRLQAGGQLTNIAKELGGNLLRFNVEQRKAIFEYLDFSGEEGKKLKSEFLQASGFVSKPKTEAQDKYGAELNQLNNRLLAAMAVREQAQSLIIRDQQTLQAQFFEQLTAQNEQFFNRLSKELLMTQVGGAEQRQRQVQSKIRDMEAAAPSISFFDNLDNIALNAKIKGGGQSIYDQIRPKSKEISSFLFATEQINKIDINRRNFEKVGSSDMAFNALLKPSLDIPNLVQILGKNTSLQGLDIGKLAADILARNNGRRDTKTLAGIMSSEIEKQFALQQVEQEKIQVNLANSLGIEKQASGSLVAKAGKEQTLGNYVLDLANKQISSTTFSKAVDDVERLGGLIGGRFYNQIAELQVQSNNAAQNIQNLNNQLNLLNRPINQGFQPQANPLAPRPAGGMKTGGMVTHSSGMAGADPKIFKPIGTDVVPTMLEPGEYVVNAKATSENLPLLQALNGGGTVKSTKAMSAGGPVRYLQDGAFIGNINDPINVNRIEAEKLAAAQRKLRVDYAIIYKFATLRGSWRKNALNNSLRLQAGNSDLTKVPYGKQINDISAIVVKNNVAPWTQINNLNDTGLNLNNLDANQANKFLEMIKNRQVYGMPLAIKQVNFQQILDATEDYLRGDFSKNQKEEFFNKNVNIDRSVDRYGNTKEYYKRRANLKPYFEDLLMAGSPPDKTGVNPDYFEINYGLKDTKNIRAIGFSKGGQAGKRIPAMVQPGEFIVNANTAKKNKGLLDYMNIGGEVKPNGYTPPSTSFGQGSEGGTEAQNAQTQKFLDELISGSKFYGLSTLTATGSTFILYRLYKYIKNKNQKIEKENLIKLFPYDEKQREIYKNSSIEERKKIIENLKSNEKNKDLLSANEEFIKKSTAKPRITSRVIAGITSLFPDIKKAFAEDSAKGGIFGKIQKFFGNNTKNLSSSTTSQPTSGLNALDKNGLVEILKNNKISNDTKNIATDKLLEQYNLAEQTESIKDPIRRRNIAIGVHAYENNQSLNKPKSLTIAEFETLGNTINTRKAEITPEAKAKEAIENARKKGVEINKEFKQDKYKYKFEDEKTSTLQEFEKAQRKKLPNDFLQKELDAKYGPKVKKEIINEKGQKVEIKGRFDSKGNLINIPSEVIEKIQGRNPYLLANEIYNERRSSFTNREVFNRFAANEVPLAPEYIAKRNARIAKNLAVYQNLEMVKNLRAQALNEAQTIIQQEINANIENQRMALNARRQRLAEARAKAGGVGAQAGRVQPVQPVVAPVVQPLPAGGVAAPAGGARAQAGGVEAPKNVGQQQPAGEAPKNVGEKPVGAKPKANVPVGGGVEAPKNVVQPSPAVEAPKNVGQQQPAPQVKPVVQPPPAPQVKPKYRDPSTIEGGNAKPGPKPLERNRFGHPTGDTSKPNKSVVPPSTKPITTPPSGTEIPFKVDSETSKPTEGAKPKNIQEIIGGYTEEQRKKFDKKLADAKQILRNAKETGLMNLKSVGFNFLGKKFNLAFKKPVSPPSTKPTTTPSGGTGTLVGPPRPTKEELKAQAEREAAKNVGQQPPATVEKPKLTIRQVLEQKGVTPNEIEQLINQFPDIVKSKKINKIMEAVQIIRNKNEISSTETNNQINRANVSAKKIVAQSSKFNMVDGGKTIAKYGNYAQIALPLVKTAIVDYMNGLEPNEIKQKLGEEAATSAAFFALFEGLTRIPKVGQFAGPLGLAFLPQTANDLEQIGTALTTNKNQGLIKSVIENYKTFFPEIENIYDRKKYEDSKSLFGQGDPDTTLTGQAASFVGTIGAGALVGSALPIPAGGTLIGGAIGFLIASYKFLKDTYAKNLKKGKMVEAKELRKYLQPRFSARGMGSDNAAFFEEFDSTTYTKLLEENPSLYFNNFSDELESYGILTDNKYQYLTNKSYLNRNPYTSIEDAIIFEKLKEQNQRGIPESFISEINPLQKNGASEQQLNKVRAKYDPDINPVDFILNKFGKIEDEKISGYDKSAIFGKLFVKDKNILNISELESKISFDYQNKEQMAEIAKLIGVKIPDDQEYSTKDLNRNYDVFRKNLKLEQLAQSIKITANLENLEDQKVLSASEKIKKQKGGLYVLPIQRRRLDDYINQIFREVSSLMDEPTYPIYTVDGLEGALPIKIDTDKEKRKNLQKNIENELFNGFYPEDATKTDLLNYVQLMKNINDKKYYKDRNYGVKEIKYDGLLPQYLNIENAKKQNDSFLILQEFRKNFGAVLSAVVPFFNNNLFNTKFDELQYISKDGNLESQEDFFKYDKNKIKKDLGIPENQEISSKNIHSYFEKNKNIKYSWNGAKENNLDQPIAMASGGIVPSSAPNPDPSFFVPKGTDTVPAILSPGEYVVNAKATAANLPLLQNLNKGGAVKYLYRGGDLQAINPYYAAYSGQSPGRGYIYSRGRGRTDFDIGTQGYLASRVYNPRSNANTLFNMGNYMADRSGFLNKPGYARYNYNAQILKKHAAEFGLLPKEDKLTGMFGSISFGGGPIPNLIGGLNTLSDYASPRMAGAAKFAMEDLIFQDILNNKEISRGPVGGYQMSNVGSRYISGLIGGPPSDKVSLKDYINELGFSQAGNKTFQGVGANKALAMGSLADVPGSNINIAQQAISSIQTKGLGNLSVNNTDVAATTALETIKNARMNHYSQPISNQNFQNRNTNMYNIDAIRRKNQIQGNPFFSPAPVQPFRFFANGGSTTDTQPAMLTPGEFVVSKPAVDRVGTAFLDRVNNYAKGGRVGYFAQGTNSSGPIATFDSKALQGAAVNLQSAAGSLDSSSMILSQTLQAVSVSFNSANSIFNQVTGIINTASSGMYSSSLAFERAVNSLVASLDRIPKTITLNIAPLSLNVGFDTQSVLTAIQQSLSGITLNVSNMIASAIKAERNNEMGA